MAAKRKVLIVQPLHEEGMKLFNARSDIEPLVLMSGAEADILAAVRDAHAITVRTASITPAIVDAAKNLQVVSRHGVGYDAINVPALTARGIPLTIAIHSNMVSVAEHVMFMLLALAKEAFRYDAMTRKGDWSARLKTNAWDIARKNLLVIGFGRTGSRVANRARAFDMNVSVYDPYIDQGLISAAGCTPVADYRAVLPQMDAVSTNCPLTPETTGMFSGAEFRAMKPSAVIINCARGGIVDEAALYTALTTGVLRGAGLDVFDEEPSPTANPLFTLDNVIVSPHIAGVTVEAMIRMATQCVQNVLDVFDGKLDPAVVVNPEVLTR